MKYNAPGSLDKYKARLVVKGFTQKIDADFNSTFSPIVKMVTVRVLFSIASARSWTLYQLNVSNAYFQGNLDEEVYMTIPPRFTQPSTSAHGNRKAYRLLKLLYGLN